MNDSSESPVTDSAETAPQGEVVAPEASVPTAQGLDTEVLAKPRRRTFTAKYKLQVLEELDATDKGEQGAVLRREGLYTSHIAEWRKARRSGALGALSRQRGRKPEPPNPLGKKVVELERQVARLDEELRKARLIIEVQGKVAGLLGTSLDSEKRS